MEKNSAWEKKGILFISLSLFLLMILMTACQPQVVEVEVTRIVEETITIEIEKEVEVEQEVEVIEEDIQAGAGDIEAIGSEEDDGSPHEPNSGKAKSDSDVEQTVAWLEASGVIEDPTAVRVIAPRTEQIVLVMETTENGFVEQLVVTNHILHFNQLLTDSTDENNLYTILPADQWTNFEAGIELLTTSNFADSLQCNECLSNIEGERYFIISEDEMVTFEVGYDEIPAGLEKFLASLRDLNQSSRLRVENISQEIR